MSDVRIPRPSDLAGAAWPFYEHVSEQNAAGQLTQVQRRVFELCTLRAEVNSGGFDFCFSHGYGDGALASLEAAQTLGAAPR